VLYYKCKTRQFKNKRFSSGYCSLTIAFNASLTVPAIDGFFISAFSDGLRGMMFKLLKKLWRDRKGNALVIAGAALPLVIGSAGLASDTIQWALLKRQLQRSADSAAEAGVYAEVAGNSVGSCSDVAGATYSNPVAYDVKKNNDTKSTPTCVVSNPPSSGSYTADGQAVHVTLSVQRALSFSGMFMSSAPTITASATATVIPSGDYCVVSLESSAVTGIDATGSTNVNLGCGMITNSTSMSAAVATGSSSVTASPIAAVGGIPSSTHWGTGTVLQPFTLAQADPFANVYPSAPGGVCNADPSIQPNNTASLAPGCYTSLTVHGTANLAPGTYYIDGGSIDFNSQAVVKFTG
jgi:Flp pilus assembly protein TadG